MPFLEQSRQQFHRLQAAYDAGDRALLADVMTPELFAEVVAASWTSARSHVPTEVVALNPEIVEVTTEGNEHWASVRFRGLLREDGGPMPKSVRRDVEPGQAGRRVVGLAAGRHPATRRRTPVGHA